jgi:adenosylhomocysteine nucleosidase
MRMLRILTVAMTLALPGGAQAAPEPARTAVISAFAPELEALKAATTERQDRTIHGVVFTTGRLEGKPVVLFLSGVSMVNAAMTTQLALDRFDVRRIVVSGVGGGADPGLEVGDVVAPERWGEYQETAYTRAAADGFAPSPLGEETEFAAFGMALPRGVTVPGADGKPERRFWFEADPALLATARSVGRAVELSRCAAAACLSKPPRIVVGGNGVSGPTFVDNAAYRQYAYATFQARVLDMETAAVAHVAHVNGTPFLAFRSLSDLAGGDPADNQFPVFIRLAAENSARTVRAFVKALPD